MNPTQMGLEEVASLLEKCIMLDPTCLDGLNPYCQSLLWWLKKKLGMPIHTQRQSSAAHLLKSKLRVRLSWNQFSKLGLSLRWKDCVTHIKKRQTIMAFMEFIYIYIYSRLNNLLQGQNCSLCFPFRAFWIRERFQFSEAFEHRKFLFCIFRFSLEIETYYTADGGHQVMHVWHNWRKTCATRKKNMKPLSSTTWNNMINFLF